MDRSSERRSHSTPFRPSPLALALIALSCGPPDTVNGPPETGPELLARSIEYHDPEDLWPSLGHTLVVMQERPDGDARRATIRLDVPTGSLAYEEDTVDGTIRKGVAQGTCFASIDGAPPTDEMAKTHRLDCANVERTRNYYLYLWGLPMKLTDPGTHVDSAIERAVFDERATLSVKVTYDSDVGSDTWYYYFDPVDYRLVGYRFYHDEEAGDGEYILLREERDVLGMRIPAVRRWFTNQDSTYLGTDRLVEDFQGQPAEAYR